MEAEGVSPRFRRGTPTRGHDPIIDMTDPSCEGDDSSVSSGPYAKNTEGRHGKHFRLVEEMVLMNIQEMELRGLAAPAGWYVRCGFLFLLLYGLHLNCA